MRDWTAARLRYLVHFSDGGSGMRHRKTPLNIGDESLLASLPAENRSSRA